MHSTPRVDISRSRKSRSFEDDERLWAKDLDRLIGMIQEHTDDLEKHFSAGKEKALESAPNLSLAVFGPAGSGKSSFLRTLVEETRKTEKKRPELQKVASLDILQPARFGDQDHLLFACIAAGLAAHRREQKEALDYQVLTPVLRSYRDLSSHLRVLHEEKLPEDLEPQALAAEVIQRHTSGLELGDKVENFINELANDLNGEKARSANASVVLLPVDDLDLAPHHLKDGLRQLQAYLLHPRLVPVFCFTDRLAEEILTGTFTEIVGEADSKRQKEGRLRVSEELAVQYLSKCFPIRNRIRLGPTPAVLQGSDLGTDRGRSRGQEPILWTLITASTLLFGVADRSARHPVRSSLRPSTLRRQFHVVDAMRQARVHTLLSPGTVRLLRPSPGEIGESDDRFKRIPDATWGVLFDRAAWALMNVHRDVLREFGMHLEDLYSWTPHALRRVLLDSLFRQPASRQIGLWQRWRSLSDSRRSEIISLLAVNAHRPWLDGEVPSGEDLPQVVRERDVTKRSEGWCRCERECEKEKLGPSWLCKKDRQTLEAPLALLWFLDLAVGFYLPFGRSVFRHLKRGESGVKEPLHGAGWAFQSAPVQAAQAAHDDEKLFPAGMMFLDPFSYAIALTSAPRMEACRVLDDTRVEDEHWNLIKRAKTFFLGTGTRELLKVAEAVSSDDLEGKRGPHFKDIRLLFERAKEAPESGVKRAIQDALEAFKKAAAWERGEATSPLEDSGMTQLYEWISLLENQDRNGPDGLENIDRANKEDRDSGVDKEDPDTGTDEEDPKGLRSALRRHDYSSARVLLERLLKASGSAAPEGDLTAFVAGLEAAAEAVHDDQLMLRVWTCYGYNRGQFWAAASLWRGLGLMGQLIESERRWRIEFAQRTNQRIAKLADDEAYRKEVIERIEGILHTHSLRGLVPGRDLGEPSHDGTLELAFAGWNTDGQRAATTRLAERLQSWLQHNWNLDLLPNQSDLKSPRWSGCFVRRLHGDYVVGSLWQWLDVEFMEHQGDQYGERRSYYWNAGVALTSWLRVLQRYFNGSYELRWMLETCPITGPFLSRSPTDPLLSSLSSRSYSELLSMIAGYSEDHFSADSKGQLVREAKRFRAMTERLQTLWRFARSPEEHEIDQGKALELLRQLCEHKNEAELEEWAEARGHLKVLENRIEYLEARREPSSGAKEHDLDQVEALELLRQLCKKKKNEAELEEWGEARGHLRVLENRIEYLEARREPSSGVREHGEGDKPLRLENWRGLAKIILRRLLAKEPVQWKEVIDGCTCDSIDQLSGFASTVFEAATGVDPDGEGAERIKRFKERYENDVATTLKPRPLGHSGGVDPQSAGFEIASMVQQFWKVTAHASAANLFYQLPRVRRHEFSTPRHRRRDDVIDKLQKKDD